MQSVNKCEFCGREFTSQKIVRVVQNVRHTFCSVGCFVCWRYKRPSDALAFYNFYTTTVPGEQLDVVISEILPDTDSNQKGK